MYSNRCSAYFLHLLKTVEFFLPKTCNLLLSPLPPGLVFRLPTLHLADPNLFNCRPVDLLLATYLYPKILLDGIHRNIIGSLLSQNSVLGWVIRFHSQFLNLKFLNKLYSNFGNSENRKSSLFRISFVNRFIVQRNLGLPMVDT